MKTTVRKLCCADGCNSLTSRKSKKNSSGEWHYNNYCSYHNSQGITNRKQYLRSYKKQRRTDNQQALLLYLEDHPCQDCSETDPAVLHFDHRRGHKRNMISQMLANCSWQKIMDEITKCDVVCANCHLRRTAKDQGWYKASSHDIQVNCGVKVVDSVSPSPGFLAPG